MFYEQREYNITCEWGGRGVGALAPLSDVLIVVDVLSFSTSVQIAASRDAIVYPCRWSDRLAVQYAESLGALLAGPRGEEGGYSLSPGSLLDMPAGTKLVLPSPNGSTLTVEAGKTVTTLTGCLRNATAVAAYAAAKGRRVAVIPAGERWADGSIRPAIEDLLGAGAIIHALPGTKSPEAQVAEATFLRFSEDMREFMLGCSSGKELTERGYITDVLLAAEIDVSDAVPVLCNGAFRLAQAPEPDAPHTSS